MKKELLCLCVGRCHHSPLDMCYLWRLNCTRDETQIRVQHHKHLSVQPYEAEYDKQIANAHIIWHVDSHVFLGENSFDHFYTTQTSSIMEWCCMNESETESRKVIKEHLVL